MYVMFVLVMIAASVMSLLCAQDAMFVGAVLPQWTSANKQSDTGRRISYDMFQQSYRIILDVFCQDPNQGEVIRRVDVALQLTSHTRTQRRSF